MNTLKIWLYAALAAAISVLSFVLLGKVRRLKELEIRARTKEIDARVANIRNSMSWRPGEDGEPPLAS